MNSGDDESPLKRRENDVRESIDQARGVFDRLEQQMAQRAESSDVTWTVTRKVTVHQPSRALPFALAGLAAALPLVCVVSLFAGRALPILGDDKFTEQSEPQLSADEKRRLIALGSGGLSSKHPGMPFAGGGLTSSGGCVSITQPCTPTAVNVVLHSQDFTHTDWNKLGTVVSAPIVTAADSRLAPDCTMTAEEITFAATANSSEESSIYQNFVPFGPATLTPSVYLSNNGPTGAIDMCVFTGSIYYCTVCTVPAASTIRCTDPLTPSGAVSYLFLGNATARTGARASAPAVTLTIWGAQINSGLTASGYIPTTTATGVCP